MARLKFWNRSTPTAPAPALAEATGSTAKPRRSLVRSMLGMFKAAASSSTDKWSAIPVAPDAFISTRHTALVARSREQWSNNVYVRAFVRLMRQNIVGPIGVTMQAKAETPRGKLDKESNSAIEADWQDWGKKGNCDVTGDLSFRECQNLVIETAARDGEFIARHVYGEDAGPHGYAIQFIDPQRLPVWYQESYRKDGGFIRHGIEFNRYGRKIAYHFLSTDEADGAWYAVGGRGFVRVPASEIIHGFLHEMVAQRRGLPWSSSSLFRLHHLQGFEDAAVQNARAGASQMGFIEYDEGFGPEADEDCDVAATIEAEPLSFHELPEGAHIKDFKPAYPSGEFAPFNKAMLRGASAGWGVPYNDLANDLEGVNFSSIRQGTLDAREHYKELQQWLIESFVSLVFDAWLKWRLLNGALKAKNGRPLPADKLANLSKVVWQPRRWQWIDPRADVQSALESIRGGLTSISQVIREQGRDPEQVFQEIADDVATMKAAGIPEETILIFLLGGEPKPEPKPESNNASAAA